MKISILQEVNTLKVLDIVYGLHGADEGYPYENVPYSINKLGIVRLTKALKAQLILDGDKGLIVWARKNIPSLFA